MATEVSINTDRTQKFIDHLESQKTILSSCTHLFQSLTTHFTSLQTTLTLKSQTLDSKFQSLNSNSHQTLESLSHRETSIPDRESAAIAKVHEQRENALAEFQKPFKVDNLGDALRSFARRMDSSGLLKYIMSKRKESVSLRAEISSAVMEAVDPGVLILDAVDEFVSNKIEKLGVTDKRWACGLLVQVLFPEGGKRRDGPEFGRSVVERAAGMLNKWKEEQVGGEGSGGIWGPAEAVMFLQMVVAFGLKSRFDDEFLMKLVMEHASRRDMARLAVAIGFGEKMGEMIDELVKNGKEIEAVYFASESGLTERFSLVSLLKSYIRNSKKNTSNVLNKGNFSPAATDESSTMELNSIKAVIKCVEDHNLESEFPLDVLKKKASRLEKSKAERKKSSAAAAKSKNKRSHGGTSSSSSRSQRPPSFRPAKAAKFSNTTYSPYAGRRNPAPMPQHSPVARYSGPYNYPSQSVVYDGHSTTSYPTTYGASHSQTPAAIPQQHYTLPTENTAVPSYRAATSYGVQANYVTYDYGTAAPPAYQPTPYTQQ
ncbi:FRIGIDA-like protein [Euphorbia peplus]|nr:FRIGIDA-like protein [Euphorbia peplus]